VCRVNAVIKLANVNAVLDSVLGQLQLYVSINISRDTYISVAN